MSTMNRIRAKTDWQGDTGIIVNDQDYLFDLEQIQVCSSLKCPNCFVAGKGLELLPHTKQLRHASKGWDDKLFWAECRLKRVYAL